MSCIKQRLIGLVLLQLYAYTQSALQRGVLDLFVRCEAVLPNLYIGTLTRDSVIGALAKGLDAEQLLTFLRRHAHPRALQRSPVVPEVHCPATMIGNLCETDNLYKACSHAFELWYCVAIAQLG